MTENDRSFKREFMEESDNLGLDEFYFQLKSLLTNSCVDIDSEINLLIKLLADKICLALKIAFTKKIKEDLHSLIHRFFLRS